MTVFTSSQIAELRSRAEDHFRHGRLKEAQMCFDSLCKACPRDAEAWHMLGVVYAAVGDPENAACCARLATELAPHVAAGYRNLGSFLLQLGRAADAEASFRRALSLSEGEARDHSNLGASLAAQSLHDEAIICYKKAIALNVDDAEIHFNIGASLQALARWADAARHYERACRLNPVERKYLVSLANVLRANSQVEQALAVWSQLLQLVPNDLEAMSNIGAIYYEHGQLAAAANIYARAVKAAPRKAMPLMDLGLTYLDLGNADEALECFCKILDRKPQHVLAQYNRALALEHMGCNEEALEAYAGIQPGEHGLDVIGAQAGIQERLGNFEAAHALVEPTIVAGFAGLRSLEAYARLCRHFGECEQAIDFIEKRLGAAGVDENEQLQLHFLIGELYDRQKQFGKAFHHFELGNRMKGYRYNAKKDECYIGRLIDVLQAKMYARLPVARHLTDVTPIFIVGMPRSGTTLVEQILASHPQVSAGGELPFISHIASKERACEGRSLGYPDYLPYLSQAECEEMAQSYLDELQLLAPGAVFVTDKMPHNFPFVGLIHRLFPNSPIIHCQRDPVDVCLSCYTKNFASYHNYAYDLSHLGQHYRQYQRVMTHFRYTLGVPMFETHYEALVEDNENSSRALIEHCGLPWDDRCLRFYESGRIPKTASYDQVRQPIYKRSLRRWQNYEKYLTPLFEALADTAADREPRPNRV